jgi:hypothetical protein
MSIPITKSSRSIEGYALTENFLFTTDAIRDYLDHLTPEGRLIIVAHHFPEVLRLTSISLAALADAGISNADAMKMIYTVGKKMHPLFVLKRAPFTAEESQSRHDLMHAVGFDSIQSYIPYIPQETARVAVSPGVYETVTMFTEPLVALADGQVTLEELVSTASIDMSPVSDDRPFFYKWKRGMVASVLAMLVLSVVVSVGVIVIPAIRVRSIDGRHGGRWRLRGTVGLLLGIVAFLGTAYMTVEIALFQRFILFTGNPTLSLAVILSCLLVGSGIGSLLTASATRRSAIRRLLTGALLAVLLSFAYLFILPTVFAAALGEPQSVRLLLSGLLIFPLGLVMGMPFPATLRLLGFDGAENSVPWAYAINASTSVFGSVLAVSLAMEFGFSTALVTGSFLYLAVAVFGTIVAWKKSHKLEPIIQVTSQLIPTPEVGE